MKDPRTIYLVKRLETRSRMLLDESLAKIGLTAGQYTTLSLLGRHKEVSSADLARQALITPQSMSEVIAALEKRGWIERRSSELNRRVLNITLSADGRALLSEAERLVDALEEWMFAALDGDRLRTMREALAIVLHHAGSTDRPN